MKAATERMRLFAVWLLVGRLIILGLFGAEATSSDSNGYFIYNVYFIGRMDNQFDKKAIPFIDLIILEHGRLGRLFISSSAVEFDNKIMLDYEEYVQRADLTLFSNDKEKYKFKMFRDNTVLGIEKDKSPYFFYCKKGFSSRDLEELSKFCSATPAVKTENKSRE